MKKLNFLTKLLLLCAMIVGGTNGAWADKELVNINFTDEGTISFAAEESKTIDGVTVYSKTAATINSTGLRAPGQVSTSNNWFAIPLSGTNGVISVTVTCSNKTPTCSYYVKGYDELPASFDDPTSITAISKGSSNDTYSSVNVAVSEKNAILYLGLSASWTYITKIVVKACPNVTKKWTFNQFEGCQSDDNDKELILGNGSNGTLDYDGLYIHNGSTYKIYAQSADGIMSLYNAHNYSHSAAISNIKTYTASAVIGVDAYAFDTRGPGKVIVKAYDDATGDAVEILSGTTTKATLSFDASNTHVTAEYDATGVETIWVLPIKSTVFIEEIKFIPTSASPVTKILTIGAAGYTTFSASENYTWDTGKYPDLKVYYVSAVSNGSAVLREITAANGIPAGTGVIFQGDEGSYTLTSTESVTQLAGTNYLIANVADYTLKANNSTSSEAATSWNYTLAAGPIFKHSTGNGKLSAGKAFLRTNVNATSARSLDLVIDSEEPTGISSMHNSIGESVASQSECMHYYFDLQGRKVAQPSKGLYIVNGKKVVIK